MAHSNPMIFCRFSDCVVIVLSRVKYNFHPFSSIVIRVNQINHQFLLIAIYIYEFFFVSSTLFFGVLLHRPLVFIALPNSNIMKLTINPTAKQKTLILRISIWNWFRSVFSFFWSPHSFPVANQVLLYRYSQRQSCRYKNEDGDEDEFSIN